LLFNMKKLDKTELQTVLSFIQKRGFTYIDVQTELLDHVACRVEEIMEESPGMTLDHAIEKSHSEFGIFGFSAVEDSIIAGVTKKYNRFFWKTFLSYFGPKYILLVLFAGYALYKFQVFVNSKDIMYSIVSAIVLIAIVYLFKLYRSEYKQYLAYRLSTAYFIGLGSFYSLMNLVVNVGPKRELFSLNASFWILGALIIVFVLYLISAVQTAKAGIAASEKIKEKYKLSWV
jgi:hypothetical protein